MSTLTLNPHQTHHVMKISAWLRVKQLEEETVQAKSRQSPPNKSKMPGNPKPRTQEQEREKREQNLADRKSKKTNKRHSSAGFCYRCREESHYLAQIL